jgi:hypothetical protein
MQATDAFAAEAARLAGEREAGLVSEIRRAAARSGGALIAAAASVPGGTIERRLLERARSHLVESRYYLYLARRMGELALEPYRGLTSRQGEALRELEALIAGDRAPPLESLKRP